ncbi:MAG: thiol-disulfide isomerase/thioredoxin [Rickettsiales bacterium]|jgi:thiol-disulfide isomerase/thioredoxin
MIPEIKNLEMEFDNKLTVIGVHSGKFDNEKETSSIRKAVLKYDITHPVVNDADFKIWDGFKVSSWPTIVLIDPEGRVVKKYEGEVSSSVIRKDVKNLIKKYKYQLNSAGLPIVLEKNKIVDNVLNFPAKITLAKGFSYKNISKTNALVIANTGKHNIILTSFNGKTLLEIGSGDSGFEDGDFDNSSFNSPRGLIFEKNILYVADTGNHALRKIDFGTGKVTTIIGSGRRGKIIGVKNKIKDISLASPWDLEFFPDKNNIIIANAGTHQLLKYNISKKTISPFVGNGKEDLIDGKYPKNSLAQPSGISAHGEKLYFVDSESSALRMVDKSGKLTTLIGRGLFDFGYKNGDSKKALMQHPVGLVAVDSGIYIADTHNHVIRKYNFKTKQIYDYSGGLKGSGVGNREETRYDEPEDIIAVKGNFYVADTNNNRIVELGLNGSVSRLIDIVPQIKMPTEGLLEYLPNLTTISSQNVKENSEVTLVFDMKKGWKVNQSAPSFFNLVEIKDNKDAHLIASFSDSIISSGSVKLPKMSSENEYYIQGTVYYCEDKKESLCLIKSFEQRLEPTPFGDDKIKIIFNYQQ